MKLTSYLAIVGAFLVLAIACSSSEKQVEGPSAIAQEAPPATAQMRPDLAPLIKGPASADGLQAILATSDLGVGEQRVGFVLTAPDGLVRAPAVSVSSFFIRGDGSETEQRQSTLAVFRPWPLGTRGLYTTRLTFDRPGRWGMDLGVLNSNGPRQEVQLFFEVKEDSSTPMAGAPALRSRSKTIVDVERISQLTTGSLHDPELYQLTIAEAVESGLPSVVVMASPAFCTNAVCGPQVEVLQELKNEYKGRANFIHVDLYDNPEEIQGDLDRARLSPTVLEWGLPSFEWTFVIDREGLVSARFEAFATLEELEQALLRVL